MQTWQLNPLQPGDLLLLTFGNEGAVPFQITSTDAFELAYDPVKQGVLAGPQVGQGATPSATQAAAFLDNLLFALSPTVTSINGITDVFNIQEDFEIIQFWFGISPRTERVWVKQPYNTFTSVLDQNLIPSSTYYDLGYYDGFDSPYNMPAPVTENFVLKDLSVNWTLCNPLNGSSTAPMTWNPRLNFYINRMGVNAIESAQVVKEIFTGKRSAKRFPLGNPLASCPYNNEAYGGASPIPLSYALRADFDALLREAGYS
jgi:hypothetical protein